MGNLCARPASPSASNTQDEKKKITEEEKQKEHEKETESHKETAPSTSPSSPPKLDPKDFVQSHLNNAVVLRPPGSLHGQQFVIDSCVGCQFYLFDMSAAITIDDCDDCDFFIGPCESSVFVRNSKKCSIVAAAQQIRLRDCSDCHLDIFIGAGHPVIESSERIVFGCFALNYFELQQQFKLAQLNPFNSDWSQIHDFSAKDRSKKENWRFEGEHKEDIKGGSERRMKKMAECKQLNEAMGGDNFILHDSWTTPFTYGRRDDVDPSLSILVKVPRTHSYEFISKLQGLTNLNDIAEKIDRNTTIKLIRTKVEHSDKKVKEDDQMVGMEVNGAGCKEVVEKIVEGEEKLKNVVRISTKKSEVDDFFKMMEM